METMIPLLPSISIDETLDFYETLGFQTTYIQRKPYPYLAMRRGGIQIHFYTLKGLEPQNSHSMCLAMVPDPGPYHAEFSRALKAKLGKVPARGFPHITRFKEGQTRFTVVDPSGNSVTYIRYDELDVEYQDSNSELSGLARALATATIFTNFKYDDVGAAKILDLALTRYPDEDPAVRARAIAARIELAVALEDASRANALLGELRRMDVPDAPGEAPLPSAAELERQIAAMGN